MHIDFVLYVFASLCLCVFVFVFLCHQSSVKGWRAGWMLEMFSSCVLFGFVYNGMLEKFREIEI